MIGVIRESPHQCLDIRTVVAATTFIMWNSGDAIDIWILLFVEQSEFRDCRDLLDFVTGAHAGRYKQNEIPGPNSAVSPAESHKHSSLFSSEVIRRGRAQILRKVTNHGHFVRHVFVSNPIAFPDSHRSAHRLSVLTDIFAGGNSPGSKSMSWGDVHVDANDSAVRQFYFGPG